MRDRHSARYLLPLLALIVPLAAVAQPRMALAPGDRAPDLRGRTTAGERKAVHFDARRVTLINFWATWCEPCQDEMPALERLHAEHGEDGLEVLGVLLDDVGPAELESFLAQLGVTYPIVLPDRWVNAAWGGIGVMPTTFLVDNDGRIVRRYVGATREQIDGLVYDVQAVLQNRPLGPVVVPAKPAAVTDDDRREAIERK